jgi:adenylate cyclase class 2
MQPLEAECKFRVTNLEILEKNFKEIGAIYEKTENHRDTYLRHPCRDFRATDEALRIRRIDDESFITYKGPRLEGPIKIRPEIELPLGEGTVESWLQIWKHLGFEIVLDVVKSRKVHKLTWCGINITLTIDTVAGVGQYVEIERVLQDRSEIETAQQQIMEVGRLLGLTEIERRSYLSLLLGASEV